MTFNTLGLHSAILKAVEEEGYTTPTPIQAKAIPAVLDGKDLLASAQTGTGKTAGFTLPMLHKIAEKKGNARSNKPLALILTPTRELAVQVEASVVTYGKHLRVRSAVIYGGASMFPQVKRLRSGVDIVVATPGRLLDHVRQKNVDLSQVEMFILDEADRMLDMGFINDIHTVIDLMPKQKQSLLFSATFSKEIKRLSQTLLNNPEMIEVARENSANAKVDQRIHPVDHHKKTDLLKHLIKLNSWERALVFTRTKRGADKLSKQLSSAGINSDAIHGDKTQRARLKVLEDFKRGKIQVLCATDVAARGIDIDHLPHVVNFDLPEVAEDYVHRIGRTGRAGKSGEAISLVSQQEGSLLGNIERLLKCELQKLEVDGFVPVNKVSTKAAPSSDNRRRSGHRSSSRSSSGHSSYGSRQGRRYS